jgi:hypothetical protein
MTLAGSVSWLSAGRSVVSCYQPSLLQCISPSCCHARKSVLEAKGSFPLIFLIAATDPKAPIY